LSGKEFQEDGAATANARLSRCLYVLGIKKFPRRAYIGYQLEEEMSRFSNFLVGGRRMVVKISRG